MRYVKLHIIVTYLIAAVWLVNGLFCKVLNLTPRHERIVARILGEAHAGMWTKLIGFAEIVMALWIISGIKPRWNALLQILTIAVMNVLEFVLVPDLLLWGRWNALFALLFILLIYYHAFLFKKTSIRRPGIL
ncbi:MAG TPA: DoxX-like family protein [Puia sp.]|nr:DoxX-like family protein [Puia sp.]